MMKKSVKTAYVLTAVLLTTFMICACDATTQGQEVNPAQETPTPTPEAVSEPEEEVEPQEAEPSQDDYTEGLGDT